MAKKYNFGSRFDEFEFNPPASEVALPGVSFKNIPVDYLEFLKFSDGGEGFVGDEYLILWESRNLLRYNAEYEVEKYAPGIILFGSDGGGEAYGFDTRNHDGVVVKIPFIGMDLSAARKIADNFDSFLGDLGVNDGRP